MIRFLSAGLYTTIQDKGRFGFRKYGVPVSGAMDMESAEFANKLVNNPSDSPLLEFVQIGPTVRFEIECFIAISGATFSSELNGINIPSNTMIKIEKDDVLKLGNAAQGMFGYLAIQGEWKVESIQGSVSQYQGITTKSRIHKDDFISIKPSYTEPHNIHKKEKNRSERYVLGVYKGPEFKYLNQAESTFAKIQIELSTSINRMGYRSKRIENISAPQILTSAVQPGTVQLTPNGELIILMRDAQTTGGYARILQLNDHSINMLAQMRPGMKFKFNLIQ